MPHPEARAWAEDLLAGRALPPSSRLDERAPSDLRAIAAAGLDTAAVLNAALDSPYPARALNELSHLCGRPDAARLFDPAVLPDLARLSGASPWSLQLAGAHLIDVFAMDAPHVLRPTLLRIGDSEAAGEKLGIGARTLAEWRGVLQARAALFDLREEGDPWSTLASYSTVAEVCAAWSLAAAWRRVRATHGVLRRADGTGCAFCVLGMGKLGGDELNASSDVDLIYLFDTDEAHAPDGTGAVDWFAELARGVTELLGAAGAGLRVDMRLRPGGGSGALACSLGAAETHYESFGQAWERQMLIRTRVVAGSRPLGARFVETVRPFVFRRRMDPRALSEIRRVKRRLDAEVAVAAGGDENVKLSRGGIREMEYVVQTYQLLYGGRIPELQTPSLRAALDLIDEHELLPSTDIASLREAYTFFRRLENRIQIFDGRQNHRLPPVGPVRDALARGLGFSTAAEMTLLYDAHRRRVSEVFDQLFADTDDGSDQNPETQKEGTLLVSSLRNVSIAQLAATGIPDADESFEIFRRVRSLPSLRSARTGAALVEQLAPALCRTAAACPDPMGALRYFERYMANQNAAGTLLGMLSDDEGMTGALLALLGRGSYLADLLINNPEAFVPMFVAQDVSGGPIAVENALLEAARSDDPERALGEIRRAKTILELQIALEEIYHRKDPESAWSLIVGLARGTLRALIEVLARRLNVDAQDLGVLLLGSVGSGEPALNSDLDLVFLHPGMDQAADATRLTQRLIRELEAKDPRGFLFRTDLRLRPFGNQGVLVSSLPAAFKHYGDDAPVTTRLALLRLQPVSGTTATAFMERWADLVFARGWTPADQAELTDIRGRIAEPVPPGRLDVKNQPWTLSDIEFFTGALQLAHGAEHASLRETSTRRAIAALARAGLIPPESAATLDQTLRWFKAVASGLRILYPRPVSLLPEGEADLRVLAAMTGAGSTAEFLDHYESARRDVQRVLSQSPLGRPDV